jgi:hypothetical protein
MGPWLVTNREWSIRKPSLLMVGFHVFLNCAAVYWGMNKQA